MELTFFPRGTRVTAKIESAAHDISASETRTFLCTLVILRQIEQESLDVSVWGSADGENWGTMPLLKMPQRFYTGETKQVLDVTLRPEVKFLRAQAVANRWGRVAPDPMFVIGFSLQQIPAFSGMHPRAQSGEAASC